MEVLPNPKYDLGEKLCLSSDWNSETAGGYFKIPAGATVEVTSVYSLTSMHEVRYQDTGERGTGAIYYADVPESTLESLS